MKLVITITLDVTAIGDASVHELAAAIKEAETVGWESGPHNSEDVTLELEEVTVEVLGEPK